MNPQDDHRKYVNHYFPPIETNQLRNLIAQSQDDHQLQIMIQILRRFKQTTEKVEEIIKFTLAKLQNSQHQLVQTQLHEEVVLSLIETKFHRQALIENGNSDHSFLKKHGLLEDLQNALASVTLVEEKICSNFSQRQMPSKLDDQIEPTPKKPQQHKQLQLPKGQRVIQHTVNLQDPNHVEKLCRKNQQFLSALGLKFETKKTTTACQTDNVETYQPLKQKQRKSEQKLEQSEKFSFYEQVNHDQGISLQYLPTCDTEEKLSSDISQFVQEIESYNKTNKPNFDKLINEISGIVSKIFQGADLQVYGSYATELCLPHSDIDLVIKVPNSTGMFLPDLLRNLDIALRGCKFIEETKCITQSTTPVLRVKCGKAYKFKRLDISIQENKHNGLQCVQLIKQYINLFPPLKPLALILKQFLYCSDLSDTYSGGLSSYGLILMIVSFLQTYQNDSKNWPSLGTLLIEFLNVYGCELDYAGKTIFPAVPQDQPEVSIFFDPQNFVYCSQQSLIIIDPMNKANNVGRPTYNISKLKLALTVAFAKLVTFDANSVHPLTLFFNCAKNIQFSLHSVLINQYKAYADHVLFVNPNDY